MCMYRVVVLGIVKREGDRELVMGRQSVWSRWTRIHLALDSVRLQGIVVLSVREQVFYQINRIWQI